MNYTAALEYLDSFVNLERHLNRAARIVITLDRVRELAQRLGNPQQSFRSVHVAGTKGKGSTCAFAASIFEAAGLKTGLYISPHLQDVRERLSINGAPIPPADFARLLEGCRDVLEQMRTPPPGQRRPTYFEVLTHLAFSWFAEQQVDVAVIEVGLGGRLDATNIITPEVCAITNISFDHMAILGDTLAQIAQDKAGIIKPLRPVVCAPQVPEVQTVLLECARAAEAPIEFVGRELQLEARAVSAEAGAARSLRVEWPMPAASLRVPDGTAFSALLGLRGSHQLQNWALAVRLTDLFMRKTRQCRIPAAAVERGSRQIRWPGRLEELPQRVTGQQTPFVLLDGAHNDHSLNVVLQELKQNLSARRPLVVLFACAKDKDSMAMLQVLQQAQVDQVIFTHSGNSRGKDPHELATEWRGITGQAALVFEHCAEALAAATQAARAGVLLITGSLYLVGAIKDATRHEGKVD